VCYIMGGLSNDVVGRKQRKKQVLIWSDELLKSRLTGSRERQKSALILLTIKSHDCAVKVRFA